MHSMIRTIVLILSALAGLFFLLTGLRWSVAPEGAAAQLHMSLLNGAALSSQIADFGSFFLSLGVFIVLGLFTQRREWFLACAILLFAAAILRIMAYLFHGATLLLPMIAFEFIVGMLLLISARLMVNGPTK